MKSFAKQRDGIHGIISVYMYILYKYIYIFSHVKDATDKKQYEELAKKRANIQTVELD